jgi:CRISPR/Cas system-associated exonuclease Cas4 (RecB family)
MKPFLVEVAEQVISENPNLEDATVIFPNKRAVLYFRHYLSQKIANPVWSPRLYSIEDWMCGLSDIRQADKLDLIHRLYLVYNDIMKSQEPFEQFYFWGDMLLQDFEEIDKYLVNPEHIFRDLRNLKELDASFDYLTEEQRKFLMRFWSGFADTQSGNKDQFLTLWKRLAKLYDKFTKGLVKDKVGHSGVIFRDVVQRIKSKKVSISENRRFYFAGFNALTKSEETAMVYFVEHGAKVFWDGDHYFDTDTNQEAGLFLRTYRQHAVLGKTLPAHFQRNIKDAPKRIIETAAPNKIGQAKLMVQDLKDVSIDSSLERGGNTVIVLADESMLLPVLHALPQDLSSVNVTMGFPLRNTPMFNLLDNILDLQTLRRGHYFNHTQVNAILGHAHIVQQVGQVANTLRINFIEKNRVLIHEEEFVDEPLLASIFKVVSLEELPSYLLDIVQYLGATFEEPDKLNREYAYHFYRTLAKLKEIMQPKAVAEASTHVQVPYKERMKAFQKLFRQVVQSVKIAFVGEPLKGVQVMGILETRNLDFENVFVLNLNEGFWPANARQSSYIPYSLRKAYGLPTFDHTDAIYAYLFYRLLQRSSNVFLYYNSEPDELGTSEMSRFLRQLNIESKLPIEKRVLGNKIQLRAAKAVSFSHNELTHKFLHRFVTGEKVLSPTVLNDFIECKLRFYLKHVAGYREADEVEEGLDAKIFGNLLHDVLLWVYEGPMNQGKTIFQQADFDTMQRTLPDLLDRAFRKRYALPDNKAVSYEGPWLVMYEIILDFAKAVLRKDESTAPITVQSLEREWREPLALGPGLPTVWLGGKIDRVDRTNETIRIIDYKTGKDDGSFASIESLFKREAKRNKAAFQTLFYSWVVKKNERTYLGTITPGLYNKKVLFGNYTFGLMQNRVPVNAVLVLPEFEQQLTAVVKELYSADAAFDQTPYKKSCQYCAFRSLCRR